MQFLAVVRRRTEQFTDEQFAPLLDPEAEAIRVLYSKGIVRAVWGRGDALGAVTLLEADSLEHAQKIVDSYPLMQKGMLELQMLIPIGPYRGFGPRQS